METGQEFRINGLRIESMDDSDRQLVLDVLTELMNDPYLDVPNQQPSLPEPTAGSMTPEQLNAQAEARRQAIRWSAASVIRNASEFADFDISDEVYEAADKSPELKTALSALKNRFTADGPFGATSPEYRRGEILARRASYLIQLVLRLPEAA